ncbi:MAG: MaoC family dehydratase N-terminal domain-containing protein [Hyphomonas sp.]|nr:MaoC family dehydratase N-terminal domain-containing protein [Hyphomonas sp.]
MDQNLLGTSSEPVTVPVEAGQLKFFAKATGETNPVYFDDDAAMAAGHPALPAPPTFCFTLNLARKDPFAFYTGLGLDLGRILHAEEEFEYVAPVYAGDTITIFETLVDMFAKKGGALEFYVFEGIAINQRDEIVVKLKNTIVHRNG